MRRRDSVHGSVVEVRQRYSRWFRRFPVHDPQYTRIGAENVPHGEIVVRGYTGTRFVTNRFRERADSLPIIIKIMTTFRELCEGPQQALVDEPIVNHARAGCVGPPAIQPRRKVLENGSARTWRRSQEVCAGSSHDRVLQEYGVGAKVTGI